MRHATYPIHHFVLADPLRVRRVTDANAGDASPDLPVRRRLCGFFPAVPASNSFPAAKIDLARRARSMMWAIRDSDTISLR